MRGISRASAAQVEEQLEPLTAEPARASALGGALFAVAGLLATQPALRRALTDPSRSADARAGLASAVLSGKVSDDCLSLLRSAAAARWSAPGDLTDAIERLAVQALVAAAELGGRLDELEDELFRFGRVVASAPELRIALTNPLVPDDAKRGLLNELLAGKVTPEALLLVTQATVNTLGRSLDVSLEEYARIAAQRRERLVAEVHVAVPLSARQRARLTAVLAAAYGHQVHLNVLLDPKVAGGMTIKIGDDVIDGSVATRLAEARRRMAA
jgi:F-type H+-transporting ATPase subunit delta